MDGGRGSAMFSSGWLGEPELKREADTFAPATSYGLFARGVISRTQTLRKRTGLL